MRVDLHLGVRRPLEDCPFHTGEVTLQTAESGEVEIIRWLGEEEQIRLGRQNRHERDASPPESSATARPSVSGERPNSSSTIRLWTRNHRGRPEPALELVCTPIRRYADTSVSSTSTIKARSDSSVAATSGVRRRTEQMCLLWPVSHDRIVIGRVFPLVDAALPGALQRVLYGELHCADAVDLNADSFAVL